MRRLFLAVACVIFAGLPVQARQDEQTDAMRVLLRSLQDSLKTEGARDFSAPTLIGQAGLAPYVTPEQSEAVFLLPSSTPAFADPVEGQSLDLRLAMTMISQSYGPEDTFAVLAAQRSPNLRAVMLRKGRASLADIRRLVTELGLQTTTGAGSLQLDVPLIIWSGATLVLGPSDVIELNREQGAFVANFGHLDMDGATITSFGPPNASIPSFTPFVITADGGTVQARNARISHLGFGPTLKFSGFSVMRGILHTADRQNRIEGSIFDDLVSVATNGASDILIADNQFRDMRGPALDISRSLNATLRGNLFSGKMPTNAIRIGEGSAHSRVEGNVILGGKRAGIIVNNDSTAVTVTRNVIWHRDGGGITITKSDCAQVTENVVIDNRQKGIEVRVSLDAKVERNTLLSNHNAGIWVAGQPRGAQTYLSNNVLAANGSGLAGAIGEVIHLQANDFTNQFPQFLSGDLTPQFVSVAKNLRGTAPITLLSADSEHHEPVTPVCSNQE